MNGLTLSAAPLAADDAHLLNRAAAWRARDAELADLTVERLREIGHEHGLEFATAVFHDRALRDYRQAPFHKLDRTAPAQTLNRPDLIGVVPGAFYRENRHTGADGARVLEIARELGCAAELIPVNAFGRIDENARIIREWLRGRRGRHLALVSLSKGGSDVKRALAAPDATLAFTDVATWVSFSGIVQGTPLIAWLRARPLRWWAVRLLLWWRRHPGGTLTDLRSGGDAPLGPWLTLPAHLSIVHVCGVPLRRHLQHRWAPRAYDRLAALGPNDGGGILLGELSRVPGLVCPIWGADHYLTPSWNATPLLRDIVAAALASAPRHATQSASTPTPPPASRSTT